MGSDSDLEIMQEAAEFLDKLEIPYEMTIASAHRSPERMAEIVKNARERGIRVIVAGAGGAAHIAGVAASLTHLPVIGVPIKSQSLGGLDSLLSMVQMPPGVPVATVAVNGGKNAGILAAQILAASDEAITSKLKAYKEEIKESVLAKAAKLEALGYKKYGEQKGGKNPGIGVLAGMDIPELGQKHSGKVRDFYIGKERRVLITTDRQSAFDVQLGHVPYKGAVLNLLSEFWFAKTRHIVPNHMISVPDPNVMIVKNSEAIPIEMIVRGYISGVTQTSLWYSYERGERMIYGMRFPDGLRKNQKLPNPVITPTTHGGGPGGHDERLTKQEIIEKSIADKGLYEQMERISLELFAFGSELCERRGVILVDTKYEFGICDGQLTLIDEFHTPDSSRFWIAGTYQERFEQGLEPENFDKEFIRLWYAERGYKGDGPAPPMSEDIISQASRRYIEVYEKITGNTFERFPYLVEDRIKKNIRDALLQGQPPKAGYSVS